MYQQMILVDTLNNCDILRSVSQFIDDDFYLSSNTYVVIDRATYNAIFTKDLYVAQKKALNGLN